MVCVHNRVGDALTRQRRGRTDRFRKRQLRSALIQPHAVGAAIRHETIQVAVTIHVAQGHAPADGDAQALATVLVLPAAVVQPQPIWRTASGLARIGHEGIQVVVPVHIPQRHAEAPGVPEALAAVDQPPRAVVEPNPVCLD